MLLGAQLFHRSTIPLYIYGHIRSSDHDYRLADRLLSDGAKLCGQISFEQWSIAIE